MAFYWNLLTEPFYAKEMVNTPGNTIVWKFKFLVSNNHSSVLLRPHSPASYCWCFHLPSQSQRKLAIDKGKCISSFALKCLSPPKVIRRTEKWWRKKNRVTSCEGILLRNKYAKMFLFIEALHSFQMRGFFLFSKRKKNISFLLFLEAWRLWGHSLTWKGKLSSEEVFGLKD